MPSEQPDAPSNLDPRGRWPLALAMLMLLAGLALAWLAYDTPLAPGLARGWLQADALSALTLIVLGGLGAVARPGSWQTPIAALAFALATLTGHLALAATLLVAGGVLRQTSGRSELAVTERLSHLRDLGALRGKTFASLAQTILAVVATAAGLVIIGVAAGEWRYSAPGAGSGLSSPAFALVLLGAILGGGGVDVARGRPPSGDSLSAVVCLYALLRLYSLGPWPLGWQLATLVAGAAMALGAAWQAAAAPPRQADAWMRAYLYGFAIVGAGLGSGAGVTLAGYALLTLPVVLPGLEDPALPRAARWLIVGAAPLTAPFILAWMAVGASVAGGLTTLAAALWLAALLMTATAARGDAEGVWSPPTTTAAALSVGLGLGAPLAVIGLLAPVAAQLQGGLTPFGDLAPWSWAGILIFDAARQPVATLPSLALAALLLILAALAWITIRLTAHT